MIIFIAEEGAKMNRLFLLCMNSFYNKKNLQYVKKKKEREAGEIA